MGKLKISPRRPSSIWRPNPAKRMVTSFALNKATKALSTVAVDASTTQRGNIKVVVRVRPQNQRESTVNARVVVHPVDAHMVVFDPPDEDGNEFYFKGVRQNYQQGKRHKNSKMAFDNVYGPSSSNLEIFNEVINPMLDTLLNGFNCSVFAYGATGSGKTHTMIGSKDNPGLTYQTVMELYRRLGEMENEYETEVGVSYLEVYNEAIRDLLHTTNGDLQLREDTNGVVVANLTTHSPKDSAQLLELLARGNSVRSQHPTDHNAESSRSHAVFQVSIKLRSRFTELTNKYKSAKLVMVDLAGSEKGTATGFQGQRFREGASINKSLLSLGNCINALADGKKHIPYRDSKLTRILKDSLGGNCKTVMIANVSPSNLSYDDSYNTLRYADRAKRIKFQVKKNTMSVSACLTQYTKVVEEMSHKIELLEKELNEYKKKCHCNVQKVDVSTGTCPSLSPPLSQAEPAVLVMPEIPMVKDVTEQSTVPLGVLTRITEISNKSKEIIRTFYDAKAVVSSVSSKIGVKEKRIETIRKLKPFDEKKTAKVKKLLEPLTTRRQQAIDKSRKAQLILAKMEDEVASYRDEYDPVLHNSIAMKISDFFELQSLKGETQKLLHLKIHYQTMALFYLEEWQKSEHLLGKAIEFLSSQFLMSKHYKNTTKQNDADYDKLVSNLCGTKVHWDMDALGLGGHISQLQSYLNDTNMNDDHFQGVPEPLFFVDIRNSPMVPNPKHKNKIVSTPPRPHFRVTDYMDTSMEDDNFEIQDARPKDDKYEDITLSSLLASSSKENRPGDSQYELMNKNYSLVKCLSGNFNSNSNKLNETVTVSSDPGYNWNEAISRPNNGHNLNETVTLNTLNRPDLDIDEF